MIRILALALLVCGVLRADDGGSVVVVYNSNMPESKSLAEYYAGKRSVPSEQVIGLPLSKKEAISRDEFNKDLVEPLLKQIEQLKLMTFKARKWTNGFGKETEAQLVDSAKIRYATLCFGVPVKIEPDSRIHEAGYEKAPPQNVRNEAAVDSDLCLLPMHYAKLPLSGPIGNRYYGTTNIAAIHPTNGLLIVTRLDGPTVEIARGLVDKALQAEKEGLWGRAYFDMRGITTGEYKAGDDMLRAAKAHVARYGFEIVEDNADALFDAGFPMPQIAIYAGWYSGHPAGAMARTTVEFMPGAFAYHLHSFSAETVRTPNEHWVGPLLARGATCTMGCVYEPYLQGTPDIAAFIGSLIYQSSTFGEAAYVAQKALSWQTTVIGDPLYTPFKLKPQERHGQLTKENSKLIEWSLLQVVNINLATELPADQAIAFLQEQPQTKTSALLSEKLGDLLKSKGRWLEALEPFENALKLNPTPLERLKIAQTLAPMEANLGHERVAYELYQGLLKDYSDNPDRVRWLQKILPLSDKFGKQGEAAEYERMLKELTPKS